MPTSSLDVVDQADVLDKSPVTLAVEIVSDQTDVVSAVDSGQTDVVFVIDSDQTEVDSEADSDQSEAVSLDEVIESVPDHTGEMLVADSAQVEDDGAVSEGAAQSVKEVEDAETGYVEVFAKEVWLSLVADQTDESASLQEVGSSAALDVSEASVADSVWDDSQFDGSA
jgi:hypothetical protein